MADRDDLNHGVSAQARLLRGFAVDFLTSHDLSVVEGIMDPAYRLTIGGHIFEGRDQVYLPAAAAQLDQFPGLVVTVHDVLLAPDAVAMRFSEHGVSGRNRGRAAVWGGITMFRLMHGRILHGWADEDYFARKRQLTTGVCDAVKSPHPAPWDFPVETSDPASLDAIRRWLGNSRAFAGPGVEQICAEGPAFAELIIVDEFRVDVMMSAGARVVFRAISHGRYAGGFADIDRSLVGRSIDLSTMGIATVRGNEVCEVQIVFDRLGLFRSLADKRS
ncbi:MAG TPA: nuclear transport factor 2 family protein [Steroidobacteraceae bacterium]|nr:nuclear transport factor 2 family protein [Steroidobacteraceae bacterium]